MRIIKFILLFLLIGVSIFLGMKIYNKMKSNSPKIQLNTRAPQDDVQNQKESAGNMPSIEEEGKREAYKDYKNFINEEDNRLTEMAQQGNISDEYGDAPIDLEEDNNEINEEQEPFSFERVSRIHDLYEQASIILEDDIGDKGN